MILCHAISFGTNLFDAMRFFVFRSAMFMSCDSFLDNVTEWDVSKTKDM